MTRRQAILIAEDSAEDVILLKRAFLKAGIDVPLLFAQDGEEAIQYLAGADKFADRATYPFPGLFLLDLKMPKVNGFEVLEWLQKQPGLNRLLITVFTSSAAPIDVNRAYDLGANSYLIKPSSASDYVKTAERIGAYWLELNQAPECAPELA